ncbi:MAG: hypothetical protein HYZ37_16820 [Candidatus Solibacter usitatus]|nr:hypothetical protein [Candidatus Solibacter usitatus]
MILRDEILEESYPVKRIMAKVRAGSLEEGREAEARRALRLVLQRTIPSLAESDLIEGIGDVAHLEELLGLALDTRDEAAVRSAMERAASQS